MDSEQVYRQNYAALLDLPIVKELLRKNKKLRKENKSLKNLIYSLPEFRCICSNVEPSRESTTRTIRIKREPVASEPTECETLTENDDVVFIDKNKQNIVYVINEADDSGIDDEVDLEEQEEEQEEDEVEEEQEEVEVEEEEEQDEVDEEQEQDEVEEEEQEEVEEEEEVQPEPEPEAEEEVFEVKIAGKAYYTTNQKNGKIYAVTADEDIGDEVGAFVDSKAKFHKKK
jgi:hypothetical protein